MYDGVYEKEFTENFNEFKNKIPQHIAEILDDAIGWLVVDMNSEDLNKISEDHFVWKKPSHMNCPEIFVLFRVDEENNVVYILDFYDVERLNEAMFLHL